MEVMQSCQLATANYLASLSNITCTSNQLTHRMRYNYVLGLEESF